MNRTRSALPAALALLVVLATTWWAFAPALECGFTAFDDDQTITLNDSFRGLNSQTLEYAFTTRHMGHWQPLAWISFGVDYALGGLEPRVYHRTNVLLHCVAALLVLWLGARYLVTARPLLAQQPWRVWGAALVGATAWALHPLRTESVAWVTERRDLLATVGLLLALHAWHSAVQPHQGTLRSRGWWWASIALLALSLLAKAWGMTLWVVLLALDQSLYARHASWRTRLTEKWPHIALGLAAAAVASWAIRSTPDITRSLTDWSVAQRLGQAAQGLVWYIARSLDAQGLCALHELPAHYDPWDAYTLFCAGLVVVVGALAWWMRRKLVWIATALFVYAVLVSPVLGLQQAGPQFVADRYAHLATLPLALLLAGGVALLPVAGAWLCTALVCALLIPATRVQCTYWKDDAALWTRVLEVHPDSSMGWQGFGNHKLVSRQPDEALAAFERSVASNPRNWRAQAGIGDALHALDPVGRSDEAVAAWNKALEGYFPPWTVRTNLANHLIARRRDLAGGVEQYELAVREMESYGPYWTAPMVWYGAGQALRLAGREAEGRALLEKAAADPRTRDRALQALRPRP